MIKPTKKSTPLFLIKLSIIFIYSFSIIKYFLLGFCLEYPKISSSLIKRELGRIIEDKLNLPAKDEFFRSDEKTGYLAIVGYNAKEFENFGKKIKPKLIEICKKFLVG